MAVVALVHTAVLAAVASIVESNSYLLAVWLVPMVVTWAVLPPSRMFKMHRWAAVWFVSFNVVPPLTLPAAAVAMGWLLGRLFVVEFPGEATWSRRPDGIGRA